MKPSRPKKGTAASKTTSKSKPSKTASPARAAKSSAKGKPPTRASGKKAPAAPKKAAPQKAAPKSKGVPQSTSKSASNQRGGRAAQQEHGHAHSHPHEHRHAHEHGHEEHDHDHDHDHGDHDHDHDHANGHHGHDHDHDHDHAHYIAVPSVRPQPLIAVHDVGASARWYAQLLAAERVGGDTHGNTYDRVVSDEQLILQLHAWDEENHPNLTGKDTARLGHGMLLWFEVDDFDDAVKRARDLGAEILEEPHVNPGPAHREFWIRDPDGYVVVIVSPDGEVEEEVADAVHARGEQA